MNVNPVLCRVSRGEGVESWHRGAWALADANGDVVASQGPSDQPTWARSTIKSVQALPLVETGAADALGLGEAELALACASHAGQEVHTAVVTSWLARLGLDESALRCGGEQPAADNCSGKHCGFLTVAVHLG